MNYNLHTENITLSEIETAALAKKFQRLKKHLTPPFTIDVTFIHDSHHLKGDVITCRINIKHGKKVFHAERVSGTVADTMDQVIEALERELARYHSKQKDRHEG